MAKNVTWKCFVVATFLVATFCGITPRAADAESIALRSKGGAFVVPVQINNKITLDFTLDSGAADVAIPSDVFSTLIRTGTIARVDILGEQTYELADGSTRKTQTFRIRSLKIGNLELKDVTASVAPAEGSLLLGQSFLTRLTSWSIDNQRHLLVMNETMNLSSDQIAQAQEPQQAKSPTPDYDEAVDAIIGTWSLNTSKSSWDPGPGPVSATASYQRAAEGISVVTKFIDAAGTTREIRFTLRRDGTESGMSGSPEMEGLTISYRRTPEGNFETTISRRGQLLSKSLHTFSEDRRMLISFTNGTDGRGGTYNNVTFYNKQ